MRTRFAPSPTGFLHVGGLRTALYSCLLAKQSGGTFILRIEDTDVERSVPGAIENILHALHWAGLNPDEGVLLENGKAVQRGTKGPYIQSERLPLYREHAKALLDAGHAYPCFCSEGRLEQMREAQQAQKQAPMYDRLCLDIPKEEAERRMRSEPFVVRMKIPRERTIRFTDEIRGALKFEGHTVDDQVLQKSDGFPTYHLAHVVDDHLMEIDLVLRGEEWLSSLPKHLLLFEELGWPPPRYAHVPLLLNKDRTKLSKRQNAVAVEEYIAEGYLPEALLNFLALLGWNPGTTQEIFSLSELAQAFSLERVHKGGAIFDREKLQWLQGQWMRRLSPEEFVGRIKPFIMEKHPAAASDERFAVRAALIRERITFPREAADLLSFFYEEPTVTAEILASEKQRVTRETLPQILDALTAALEGISPGEWENQKLLARVDAAAEAQGLARGQLLWTLRAALTGRPFSPGALEVAVELGRERTLERLTKARLSL